MPPASLKIQVYGANSNCDVNAICKSELRSSCETDGGVETDYVDDAQLTPAIREDPHKFVQ